MRIPRVCECVFKMCHTFRIMRELLNTMNFLEREKKEKHNLFSTPTMVTWKHTDMYLQKINQRKK